MSTQKAGTSRTHESTEKVSSAVQKKPATKTGKSEAEQGSGGQQDTSVLQTEAPGKLQRPSRSTKAKVSRAPADQESEPGSATATQKTSKPARKSVSKPSSYPVGFIRQYELVERVKAYDPAADEDLLNRAYVFSMKAHGGQTRSSGDPYFTHPISVAAILTELKADPETIVTALLHDTVEDTDTTVEDIERLFGPSVAELVDGVTKLSLMEMRSAETKQAENFRKFVLAMAQDVRVLLVKLADRLHNMRTLHYIKRKEKRQRIAMETMQIYAPLAGRIGVQKFRDELEDLSFKYLDPEGYTAIREGLRKLGKDTVRSVVQLSQTLREKLEAARVKAEVHSREKRPFSIWRKMQRKGNAFDELADIYAFRVLVDTVEDCYKVLGVIHSSFPMIPHEFDDYISLPKPNNYRSIHTAVLAPVDETGVRQRVEIQIRTKEMHETAERGIAAHWRYKDETSFPSEGRQIEIDRAGQFDPYEWARNAVEMLQHGDDVGEFLENAKLELFQDTIYCFTPKGRVMSLPVGATAIDFAYSLHTDIGDTCVGARVNGVTKPLRTPLRNGDVVSILRSDNAPIPQDWETMAITGRAKSGIKRRIKQLQKKEQVKFGHRILESEFSTHGLSWSESSIEEALDKLGYSSVKKVYEAVGSMRLDAKAVRQIIYPGTDGKDQPKRRLRQSYEGGHQHSIPIQGLTGGVSVSFAPCCSPLPGERIIGLPGDDGAVNVHRIDCDTLGRTTISEERWLDLRWRSDTEEEFIAPIKVTVKNRSGALAHVALMMTQYEADIRDIRLRHREVDFNDILIDILVRDVKHLTNVLTGLRASEHVLAAERRTDVEPASN
ncbi:RelA/SpoT family protein [Parvularcula flava]|uniref:GTP pyrophosphokinase rsh n=1 Tax=Aquisalinus luteolus TaxID=1566827 RepID=A0ABX0HHS5_9PROT|nr:bifunctional (p)ppGpp synthetase/guanosine-3',5'-bis(diphosphate) 3'-pyrophosphohydrolase [Aquisalinus luteolus]NHK27558.1 RelA/SpoT family protein [Aquisalinus luteolus]